MHIAYYAPAWPPTGAANGVVTYVAAMRRYLLASGHEVSVLSDGKIHDAADREQVVGTPIAPPTGAWARMRDRYDRGRGDHPLTARRLTEQFRIAAGRARFDLIEMEESFGWSGVAQDGLDLPMVTRLHGPHFLKAAARVEERPSRQRAAAEVRSIRRAAALSAPTTATMDAALAHCGSDGGATAVIPNPVEPGDAADRWRADDHDRGLLLCVGRFDHAKGADTVLTAFARIVVARPDLRLVMVGPDSGLTMPGGTVLHFAEFADRFLPAPLRARITFTGTQSPQQIAAFRRRAALTIVASRNENFPYAVVEAMAVGSPLISTAWSGSDRVIDHGRTGWLTPVGDANRLAARVLWLLDHPDAAARASAAAFQHCRERFSPSVIGARTIGFYQEVLARHAATRRG